VTTFAIISSGDSVGVEVAAGVEVATGVGVNGGANNPLDPQPEIIKLIRQQMMEIFFFIVDLHGHY
jgi:hypothetical protein